MKTDAEIKEFIDGREVLTQTDLTRFIYPIWNENSIKKGMSQKYRVKGWWQYVLETKEWQKLRENKEYKQRTNNLKVERFNKFRKIYQSDQRMQEFGKRRIRNLLIKVYDLDIPLATLGRYIKDLKNVLKKAT